MIRRLMFIAPLAILVMLLLVVLGGVVVLLLWNWLLPAIFGWPPITFWQALGILALCRILFGRFGLRGSGRSGLRSRMAECCGNMTPEERERLRERMRARWGGSRCAGAAEES